MKPVSLYSREHMIQQMEGLKKMPGKGIDINIDAYDRTLMLCDLIDILRDTCDHGVNNVTIDRDNHCALMTIDLDSPIFEYGRAHQFFQYIRLADKMILYPTRDEMVRCRFIVNDLYKESTSIFRG